MTFPVGRASAETCFSPMDRHFADFLVEIAGVTSADKQKNLWIAAALVSNYVGKGHVCLNLQEISGTPLFLDSGDSVLSPIVCPGIEEWVNFLRGLPVTGQPGDFKPLILDEKQRLYLYRYWLYEQQLARSILGMKGHRPGEVDMGLLTEGLQRFFPGNDETINWQSVAAALAVLNRFTVISGGPGTGKTYTVGRLLALLIGQAKGADIGIALAAPTGKAAARLTDMVRTIKEELDFSPDVKEKIPHKALTIHRLLGPSYRSKSFRYNASNRLPFDVVVIDEASMIDLPLMAKLVSSLKDHSRLILLGDKDQLASVEPGAVFGDICNTGSINVFSAGCAQTIGRLISHELPCEKTQDDTLSDSIVVLKKSFRFGPDSGIGFLATMVNEGKASEALGLLKGKDNDDVGWHIIPQAEKLEKAIEKHYFSFYREYLSSKSPEEAFARYSQFHILCALRHGPYGVVAVNTIIERICRNRGLIRADGRWYPCRPVMVTSNDYQLKLFNGDVGILFSDPEANGEPRAFFVAEGGGFRKFLPGRLKDYETAYAITVHKSQGSEFDHVAILLPDRLSDVLSKELIYTAITRAKKGVEIWGREDVFAGALARTIQRQSGLKDALKKR